MLAGYALIMYTGAQATGEELSTRGGVFMQQGNESFRLVVRRGPQPNQVYELNKDIITLGRDITNDITINDPEVSRHHMRLTRGAGGYTMEDLGSTNGTFVNGQRLTGAKPLNNGDMIGLGETVTLGYEGANPMGMGAAPQAPAAAYQPPQQGTPYAPPAQQPAQYGAPAQQPAPYSAPAQPASQQPYGYGASAPAASQQPGYSAPPAPGAAGYDPYAIREEEPQNTSRWILIGCGVLSLFCCCGTVLGLVLIDQLCLWGSLPIISDVIRAIGLTVTC